MFGAKTAGPASTVDQDARPVRASRRQRSREATGRGFAMGEGLLARVVHVVVSVIVNGRAEPAHIWVDKSDKTLSFSPY